MAANRVIIELPERDNDFFVRMANSLPQQIFNSGGEFMVPRLTPVTIRGTVPPGATVKVIINGLDQSPVPGIVADTEGNWSHKITLTPGVNTIQVQFFPPEIAQDLDNALDPGFESEMILEHPTLFTRFNLGAPIVMVLIEGNHVFVGATTGAGLKLLGRFDIVTGDSILLEFGFGPLSAGSARFLALDENWLYSSQTMGDGSIKVSRYAKDFSSRTDLSPAIATVANALHSDVTNLFYTRTDGTDIRLGKVDPATMERIGSEVGLKNGAIGESMQSHNHMADDGINLMIPTSDLITGDSPTNDILPGSPDLGSNLILRVTMFHRKTRKSDLSSQGNPTTDARINSPDESFMGKNSLIHIGGFFYSIAFASSARVVKMQEAIVSGLPRLQPIEITPLPFAITGTKNDRVPRMTLGSDGRLYVIGSGNLARFTPGSTSVQHVPRGSVSIATTANDIAVADDNDTKFMLSAASTIFSDRAETFEVVTPASAPQNLRCHFNRTHTHVALGWNPLSDGNAVIVEQSKNGSPFVEVDREYFGSGAIIESAKIGGFRSGDTLSYRVRAFNAVGSGPESNVAEFFVPFKQPPLGDPDNLTGEFSGLNVKLEWEDGEIVPGQPISDTQNRSHNLRIFRSEDGVNFVEVGAKSMLASTTEPDGTQFGGTFTFNPNTRTNNLVQFTDTTADPSQAHFYRVRHAQDDGPGLSFFGFVFAPSNFSDVTEVQPPPPAPTSVVASTLWEGVGVDWTPGVGGGPITNYEIDRSLNNGASFSLLDTVGDVTSYLDTTAIGLSQVRYRVRALGPTGTSAYSPNSNNLVSPKSNVFIGNVETGMGPLLLDNAFAYAVSSGSTSLTIGITKIDLSNSKLQTQNLDLYTAVGTFCLPRSGIMVNGFIYIFVQDQGLANPRVIKVDPDSLSTVGTLVLPTGGVGGAILLTDGTNCWAASGTTNNHKITQFDPVTMNEILTGPSLGANITVQSGTAFGGDIYIGFRNTNLFAGFVARISATTLTIVESVSSGIEFASYVANDGSNIYVKGNNQGSGAVRVEKYSVGPIAFVAQTGDFGANSTRNMVYDAVTDALYMQQQTTSPITAGFQKISTAPAFVSFVANPNFASTPADGSKTDGTFFYAASTTRFVAREPLTSF